MTSLCNSIWRALNSFSSGYWQSITTQDGCFHGFVVSYNNVKLYFIYTIDILVWNRWNHKLYLTHVSGGKAYWGKRNVPWESVTSAPLVLSMRPCKNYFWLLRLVIYFLSNLTHKTKIGPATKTGGRLLIANHQQQSNHLAIQHRVLGSAVPITTLSILWQNANAGLKPFYRAELACL